MPRLSRELLEAKDSRNNYSLPKDKTKSIQYLKNSERYLSSFLYPLINLPQFPNAYTWQVSSNTQPKMIAERCHRKIIQATPYIHRKLCSCYCGNPKPHVGANFTQNPPSQLQS